MKSFASIVLLITIIGFSYFGAEARMSAAANGSPQTATEMKIYKQILTLPYYGVFDHISFELNGGTVKLYGKVYSLGLSKIAERTVSKIDGVTKVVNNIESLPPSSFDNSIRRRMLDSFARDGGSLYRYLIEPQPSVRIIVDGGRVTLEGAVANRGDYNLADILAKGVSGVFSVENNLLIKRSVR